VYLKGFDDYFTRLKPRLNKRNPWFVEFWDNLFNCRYIQEQAIRLRHVKQCTGQANHLNSNYCKVSRSNVM